ncbi:MAG: ethanolamine ammonia-lyase subunit EutC [Acidobacteriaceae bacterium]
MAELTESDDVWARLRALTPARIGLGRAGSSLPTRALLAFDLAHAQARDAVHRRLDAEALREEVRAEGFGEPVMVSSQARDGEDYLLRPDLGRMLDVESEDRIRAARREPSSLAIMIADGLSALAAARHAILLLRAMRELNAVLLENVTVIVASRARVALGDAVSAGLGAEAVAVLIGERPGLSSPDSLAVYLTWAPQVGRTDAERNCISNIRPEGLSYAKAARRVLYLLGEARRMGFTGVGLKDDSEEKPMFPQVWA